MRTHRLFLITVIIVSGWASNSSARQNSPPRSPTKSPVYTFDFGPGKVAPGYKQVLATTIYSKELGYGFEPGAKVTCLDRGGSDLLRSDFCTSDQPFYFSVALP